MALPSRQIIYRGSPEGSPMARDSQAALIALNRFGFGARGGASGDFVNAASDPRGFVKAELARPNGPLLELPGLASTPALAKAVFDYQFEIQQARDAAAKSSTSGSATETPSQPPASSDTKQPVRRNLSLNSIALEMAPKEPAMQPAGNSGATAAAPAETMQPAPVQSNAAPPNAKPAPQQLNVIQKTFRAE